MSNTSCQQCGSFLNDEGTCPACLFNLALSHTAPQVSPNAASADLPSIDELNRQFPQLEITRLIGRGGMGAIYQARQTALDRDVALKLIARPVGVTASFSERFEREAKTLAKLSHPNIVTVYDYGQTADGLPFLVMEYVDGINLREAMLAQSIACDDALDTISAICKALAFAHSKGIVHRDIKPENILLGEDGTLKVADFGIAKIVDDSNSTPTLTATRQVLGTLNYLAPEQLESPDQVDHRVDLYAIGVIFYELLTGQLPLGRFDPPSLVNSGIDQRVDAIVMKSLARKPALRYQQAAELDADLYQVKTLPPPLQASSALAAGGHRASVPFTCQTLGGFAEIVGYCHATSQGLRIEFRQRDAFWRTFTSKTRTIVVSREQLLRAEFIPGVFSSRLLLGADNISAFEKLPSSEVGQIELRIKREDNEKGMQVADLLSDSATWSSKEAQAKRRAALETPADANRWTILACLLIFCCALNIGALAVAIILMAAPGNIPGKQLAISIVTVVFMIAPVFIMQMITGGMIFAARPRSLTIATCIVMLLPITPGWVVGAPIAIWALWWLLGYGHDAQTSSALPAKQNWGASTLMFIRESRWSKFVAAANVAALILAGLGIWAYSQGYYPTVIEYRVVADRVPNTALGEAIQQRVPSSVRLSHTQFVAEQDMPTLAAPPTPPSPATIAGPTPAANSISADSSFGSSISANSTTSGSVARAWPTLYSRRIQISTWAASRQQVIEALKIHRSIQLVWLADSSIASPKQAGASSTEPETAPQAEIAADSDALINHPVTSATAQSNLPVVDGLALPTDVASEKQLSGQRAAVLGSPLDLRPAYVTQVTAATTDGNKLSVMLSSEGREIFNKSTQDEESIAAVGLVINGMIYGIASRADISAQELRFELSGNNTFSQEAITAAIRGPELPTELELLE